MKIEIHIDDRMVRPFVWITGSKTRLAAVAIIAVMGSAVALAAPGDSVPHSYTAGATLTAETLNANFVELASQIAAVTDIAAMTVTYPPVGTETPTGGTWIDGKPIFRQVFDVGTFPTGTSAIQTLGFNYDTVIRLRGMVKKGAEISPVPVQWPSSTEPDDGHAFYADLNASGLRFGSSTELEGYQGWIVLEYTKP